MDAASIAFATFINLFQIFIITLNYDYLHNKPVIQVRSDGRSLLYGKLFEILDAFAADAAYRHCGGGKETYTIVTACVDGVKVSETRKSVIRCMPTQYGWSLFHYKGRRRYMKEK